jgi:hypothetical protein
LVLRAFFADCSVLPGRYHAFIYHVLVRIKCRLLTIRLRYLRPQLFDTFAATIADVKGNDLSRFNIHRQPNPLLVGLLLHKTGHFVGFDF